ncbi:MAG TPA: ATP-binding protein [Blastocatellia bacterium]|nr:ATP-binding protein [Blastocatellia bacterium]
MDEMNFDHLNEGIRELARTGSKEERIAAINTKVYIHHPAVTIGLMQLKDLVKNDCGIRPCGGVIVGEPGSGKSELVDALGRGIASDAERDGTVAAEVVRFEPTLDGDPDLLLREIADAVGASGAGGKDLFRETAEQIKQRRLAAVCLDDLHDLFRQANKASRKEIPQWRVNACLKLIRMLMNTTLVPFLFTMVPSAVRFLIADDQLDSRIQKRVVLPLWGADRDFVEFLKKLEREFPLKRPSNLGRLEVARWLSKNTKSTRVITQMIREGMRIAVMLDRESVSLSLLKQLYPAASMSSAAAKAAVKRTQSAVSDSAPTAGALEDGFVP